MTKSLFYAKIILYQLQGRIFHTPDDKELISDFMKQFEEENSKSASDTDDSDENAEPIQETAVPETTDSPQNQQNQNTQVPTVQQTNQPSNQPPFSLAQSVINYANGTAGCIGKYVQIPNLLDYAYICGDANYNPYLCILNKQANQYEPFATVKFENSEYAVYCRWQKAGTLSYHSFSDPVWQLIPFGMNAPQQSPKSQYSVQNNQQTKRVFNNVPPEQAGNIIRTIMESDYESPIEVNFASPTLKSGSPFIPLDELRNIIDADILPK